jgi:hypothetical protein
VVTGSPTCAGDDTEQGLTRFFTDAVNRRSLIP